MSNLSKVMVWAGVLSLIVLSGCFIYEGYSWGPAMPVVVLYKVDPSFNSDWVYAIQEGANVWSAISNNFSFQYNGVNNNPIFDTWDDINTVTTAHLGPDLATDFVALARSYTLTSAPMRLDECDIAFNIDFNWSADDTWCPPLAFDVRNVAAHEFGHWLHLDDLGVGVIVSPAIIANQTMYYASAMGETKKRDLAQGDIDGINHIY